MKKINACGIEKVMISMDPCLLLTRDIIRRTLATTDERDGGIKSKNFKTG